MNNFVVYTVITNGYDNLIEPETIEEGIDYICYTDSPKLKSKYWTIRLLPKWTKNIPKNKRQRILKILPHILFPEYNKSLYVDANVKIKGNIINMFAKTDGNIISIRKYPKRNCVYEEAKAVIKSEKDSANIVSPQIERYKKINFPEDFGLFETNIIFREHNTEACKKCMGKWALEVMLGSHRDQLSLTYAMWITNTKVVGLDSELSDSDIFYTDMRHTSKSKRKRKRKKHVFKHI